MIDIVRIFKSVFYLYNIEEHDAVNKIFFIKKERKIAVKHDIPSNGPRWSRTKRT